MKRIYVVSLDDEVPLSDKAKDNLKVLAYLVYDELLGYEYADDSQILCHDDIIYNELYEKYVDGEYVHRFQYDNIESGLYEPFMIGDKSFAFTVNDGKLDENELKQIIHVQRKYASTPCGFTINSVTYSDDKKKNRLIAIKKLLLDSQKKNVKKEDNIKVKAKSILPVIGLMLR